MIHRLYFDPSTDFKNYQKVPHAQVFSKCASPQNFLATFKVDSTQFAEKILKKIAKAINKTFKGLKCMLQGQRIYFV